MQEFIPHPWLRHPHLQTILADRFPSIPQIVSRLTDLKITLSDGDTLMNEYLPGKSPVVSILCHGLTGDSRSAYILRSAYHLNQLGHHVVLMNHRNCGKGFGLATKPYNSGSGKDIGEVIQFCRQKFPECRVLTYGFSLSANALMRLLSEPARCLKDIAPESWNSYFPDNAMAVNAPTNLSRTSDLLSQGLNRIYEKNFIYGLKQTVHKLAQLNLLSDPNVKKLIRLNMRIKDFDDVYTARLSGYENADDYYFQCSTYNKIENIKIPTFILTSDDDPFVDVEDFKKMQPTSQVKIKITTGGGHLGYISRDKTSLGTHRWLDYAVVEFAKRCQVEFTDTVRP